MFQKTDSCLELQASSEAMTDGSCIFSIIYGRECNSIAPCQKNWGPECIKSITIASKAYGDGFHSALQLEEQLRSETNLTVYYYKNYVSKYTRKSNVD